MIKLSLREVTLFDQGHTAGKCKQQKRLLNHGLSRQKRWWDPFTHKQERTFISTEYLGLVPDTKQTVLLSSIFNLSVPHSQPLIWPLTARKVFHKAESPRDIMKDAVTSFFPPFTFFHYARLYILLCCPPGFSVDCIFVFSLLPMLKLGL